MYRCLYPVSVDLTYSRFGIYSNIEEHLNTSIFFRHRNRYLHLHEKTAIFTLVYACRKHYFFRNVKLW